MADRLAIHEVLQGTARKLSLVRVDQNQLDLHAVGNDVFDLNGGSASHNGDLSVRAALSQLRKSRKIRGQLYEYPIRLNASDGSRHRLPDLRASGVFLPGPQKLPHTDENAVLLPMDRFDDGVDVISYP